MLLGNAPASGEAPRGEGVEGGYLGFMIFIPCSLGFA